MKTLIAALLTAFSFATVNAQLGIEWQNTIGGSHDDHLSVVIQTIDGGYIIGGHTSSSISGDKTENSKGNNDFWILKVDASGNIQWQKTIGGNMTDVLTTILQTADGGYLAGGYSQSGISGDKTQASRGSYDYWIVKLDATGNVQWDKTYGGNAVDELHEVKQTPDGGYILGGHSYSGISGDKTEPAISSSYDYWIIKVDAGGAIQWQNTIGGDRGETFSDVEVTADGGYLVSGSSNSSASGDKTEPNHGTNVPFPSSDYWIVKLDTTGSIQWQKVIGGYNSDNLWRAFQTTDGGYFLAGTSLSSTVVAGEKTGEWYGTHDYWVVKLDAAANIQWQKSYGGLDSDALRDACQTSDGGYILGGTSQSLTSGNKTAPLKSTRTVDYYAADYWVLKIDEVGAIQWQNTYGTADPWSLFSSIIQSNDGGYAIGGSSYGATTCDNFEAGDGTLDYWIIKLPAVPEQAEVVSSPPGVDRGSQLEIQFSALNFEFGQGTGIYLDHATTGAEIMPSAYSYPNDTTVIGTFNIPLFPCGKYNLVTECYTAYDALTVNCQPVNVNINPSSASACGGELQINFTSEDFDFVPGSPIYLENGTHQVHPDTFITLSDSSVVGFFTFTPNDSCGIYQMRHFAADSFSGTFELVCTGCATLSGYIYHDADTNCLMDTNETLLENVVVELTLDSVTYYATTDDNGYYTLFVDHGTYDVEVVPPGSLWESSPCSSLAQIATVDSAHQDVVVNFPLYGEYICPQLQVDISTNFLRICNARPYQVSYCNNGTGPAANAYVEVTVAPELTAVTSSIPWRIPQTGNSYIFDLGDIQSEECGSFNIYFSVSCSAQLGQTLCVLAHIFPDTTCTPPDTSWDQASIAVNAECINEDTVQFRISNVGSGDMRDSLFYIIVEDNVMVRRKKFKLFSSGSINLFERANGRTFRIEAEQSPGHPGKSNPSATVEGCGTDSTGGASTGFVNNMSQDDGDDFIAIACEEVIGSLDPNDKTGYPTGIGEDRIISSTTELEYRIRFQNTGTDTAFRVIIRDTLSPNLDVTSVELGAASHPYDFNIFGTGILEWRFENILLPDSNVNEPESHGFVRFRIAQQPGNAEGTVIENSADIYFDYNAPVKTNIEFNTVGDILKVLSTAVIETFDLQNNIMVYPNPFSDVLYVELKGKPLKRVQFEVYDVTGRLCRKEVFENVNLFTINDLNLEKGMYFYRVIAQEHVMGAGKIVRYN